MEMINHNNMEQILEELLDNLLKTSIDLDDEFSSIVDNNFWNLI